MLQSGYGDLAQTGSDSGVVSAAYGAIMTLYLLACLEVIAPGLGDALYWPATVAKLATVAAVPPTLFRLATLLEDLRGLQRLWWQLGVAWSALGVLTVAVVAVFGEQIALASAKPTASRIWPGTDMAAELGLEVAANGDYTVARVIVTEMVAMVAMAWLAALCIRAVQRVDAWFIWVVPVAVLMSLLLYQVAVPWVWIWDYDPFVGDVVLSGLLGEVVLFMVPSDPVGAVALVLGVSTLTVVARNLDRRSPEPVADGGGSRRVGVVGLDRVRPAKPLA